MPELQVINSLVADVQCLATKSTGADAPVVTLPTPPSTHSSRSTSPAATLEDAAPGEGQPAQKKKKKKKSKKSSKAKDTVPAPMVEDVDDDDDDRPPVLCISRNKHWRYISSYHGPWLQLPLELLESLLVLNLDPATLSAADTRPHALPSPSAPSHSYRPRDRGFASLGDHSPPESPRSTFASLPPPPPMPAPRPGKATPPPIDPGVFRSVTRIRRLIDEASELSVRASSGLSAAALGSLRGGGSSNSPWATAQSLGLNPLGDSGGGGRNIAMSAMRVHRLRALAVQKLAEAYRTDEIASSVMVMQGGSVFDDIAERVLKVDPHDVDARYVHFFHEKIPSRQLAESTTTDLLDELIATYPHRLEFYRTRGIVHCFRDEYALAVKDFTYAIKEARVLRKAKAAHRGSNLPTEKQRGKGSKKKKGKSHGQAPPSGTSAPGDDSPTVDGPDGEPLLLHPSVLPDAPEPIEPQCFFLRAAAYLQHAIFLIESAILKLEGIRKGHSVDGAELRLCYVENGRYGGVEIGHPDRPLDGPLGKRDGAKLAAYRAALAEEGFREQVSALVRKAMRDHEKFLAHFDTLEGAPGAPLTPADLAARTAYAFRLSEALRPGSQSAPPPPPDAPAMFTTYHPLLVEAHYSVLLCLLLLGDFPALLPAFCRTAALVDGLEGYPVFLPPRSMAQAEFVEVLERLAGGWRTGVQPHSLVRARAALALEAPRSPKAKQAERAPSTERAGPCASAATLGVNGSSSSSAVHASPAPSGRETPASGAGRADLVETLDAARILLAPVAVRQREKAEKAAADKVVASRNKGQKKPLNINIPLHGPRVEIVLAWLGAVHLVELDSVA
ncbi:hypothetical protein OBBRIDRAFT_772437 [Obba rivulosa]|uniref:Uncharacterized protein n=1 Tax=Obba rivulosa TaxID=1052685 RepID=A0A8E2AXM6_9APHY|nr:hypothetical protein OBBRIDRAFT_772437 [Obba rivulosa]